MKLRFVRNQKISDSCPVSFNRIAAEIRQSFVQAVESASKVNAGKIDWWISSPASRNIVLSPLYYYCCCIAYVKACVNNNRSIIQIETDSSALKGIIERYMGNYNRLEISMVRLEFKQRLKKFLTPIYQFFRIPFLQLLFYTYARLTGSGVKRHPSSPITLIDTFVMPGFIEKDRYYTGIENFLSENEKKYCRFVPLAIGLRPWQYLRVVKTLRNSKRNYFLKEDYLKIRDYLYAWAYVLRIFFIRRACCMFDDIDIWPLMKEELKNLNGFESSFNALLNYCFAKRLKERGIQLRLVVDWFENQSVDKGWNAGFRQFYPSVKTRGYLGFVSNSYPAFMYPTREEKYRKVIPHEIIVVGDALVQSVRTFCPDIFVRVGPAFRFQGVFQKRRFFPTDDEFTILIALPLRIDEAIHLLRMVKEGKRILKENEKRSTRFWIKAHPVVPFAMIRQYFGRNDLERFRIFDSGADFNALIEKANLLVSTGSSTCAETVAKGIPVIVVLDKAGMNQRPIPESISEDILRICFKPEEIAEAFQYYLYSRSLKREEFSALGVSVRHRLFIPVTRESVREFLELE